MKKTLMKIDIKLLKIIPNLDSLLNSLLFIIKLHHLSMNLKFPNKKNENENAKKKQKYSIQIYF
jgi:hypothetical protein